MMLTIVRWVVMNLSKYTTEVRFICEEKAGLNESVGYDKIEDVIEKSWKSIFYLNFPMFDEAYRKTLCMNILRHFYVREICSETAGLWIFWLNERMNSIMPYYNQLYKSELLEFNPLYDVDLTTDSTNAHSGIENENNTDERKNNSTDAGTKSTSNSTSEELKESNSLTSTDSSSSTDKYSDTPQGALTGLINDNYLTNARMVSGSNSGTDTGKNDSTKKGTLTSTESDTRTNESTASDKFSGAKTINNTDDYVQHVTGKNGGVSYSKMLIEFRETMLNIDSMVFEELDDLFLGLW